MHSFLLRIRGGSSVTVPRPAVTGAAALVFAACVGSAPTPVGQPRPALRSDTRQLAAGIADSVISDGLAPGVRLHRLVNVAAPWRAFVLEVDLTCSALRARKGGPTAVGRTTTSRLLASQPAAERAIAAINADFFLFAPPGVPTNLHVEQGTLLAGPGPKPVFFTDGQRVHVDTIVLDGSVTSGNRILRLGTWNRPAPAQAGIVDAHWGVPLDTLVRRGAWRLEPVAGNPSPGPDAPATRGGRYVTRAVAPRDTLVQGDTLLLHLPRHATDRPRFTLQAGDTVEVHVRLATEGGPVRLTDAVGGRPILLADSVVTRDVDTEGNAGFRDLNPRSAIGIDREGTRAWLAVIDGRQPGYSMGMTLRQVAELLQALGATRALNLDGGGSSALALRHPVTGAVHVANRPSDRVERPVGNALAVHAHCIAQ